MEMFADEYDELFESRYFIVKDSFKTDITIDLFFIFKNKKFFEDIPNYYFDTDIFRFSNLLIYHSVQYEKEQEINFYDDDFQYLIDTISIYFNDIYKYISMSKELKIDVSDASLKELFELNYKK